MSNIISSFSFFLDLSSSSVIITISLSHERVWFLVGIKFIKNLINLQFDSTFENILTWKGTWKKLPDRFRLSKYQEASRDRGQAIRSLSHYHDQSEGLNHNVERDVSQSFFFLWKKWWILILFFLFERQSKTIKLNLDIMIILICSTLYLFLLERYITWLNARFRVILELYDFENTLYSFLRREKNLLSRTATRNKRLWSSEIL
jgi:hypothetical protein